MSRRKPRAGMPRNRQAGQSRGNLNLGGNVEYTSSGNEAKYRKNRSLSPHGTGDVSLAGRSGGYYSRVERYGSESLGILGHWGSGPGNVGPIWR